MPLWGYSKNNGPQQWAKWCPEAGGEHQSPIDLSSFQHETNPAQSRLRWNYEKVPEMSIDNPGVGWRVTFNGCASNLVLDGGILGEDTYILEQFHCHWGSNDSEGSEHTIDGKTYAGELHLVHFNKKYGSFNAALDHRDGLVVLGVFLEATDGGDHAGLENVVRHLGAVQHKDERAPIGRFDLNDLLPDNVDAYFTYQGSLTTPPCKECVVWKVFETPIRVSRRQVAAFRTLKSYACDGEKCGDDEHDGYVRANFRPPLPVGRREVTRVRQEQER